MPKQLTQEQLAASQESRLAVALMAAAGSGKTSVLVDHCIGLLNSGVQPHQILAVTFTNEAARELKHRIFTELERSGAEATLLERVENSKSFGTIHSFCYRVIAQFADELELPAPQGIVDPFIFSTNFAEAYSEWMESLAEDTLRAILGFYHHRELKEVVQALYQQRQAFRRSISLNATELNGGDRVAKILYEATAPLFKQLEQRFLAAGLYSFDDLEHYALEILERSVIARQTLRQTIRRVLVDEFQDTSSQQWQLLRLLVGEETEKLFVVGDPKQSIYSFRQADPSVFYSVSSEFRDRGHRALELTHNFRSTPGLLTELNKVSQFLFPGISLSAMQAGRTATADDCETPLRFLEYGAAEKVKRADLTSAELNAVAPEAKAAFERGQSVALLFRNAEHIPQYQNWFEAQGVPVQGRRIESLTETYAFQDLYHYLSAAADPLDDYSLAAFLQSPAGGLTWAELLTLTKARERLAPQEERSPLEPLYGVLQRQAPEKVRWFVDLIENSQDVSLDAGLSALFENSVHFSTQTESLVALLEPLLKDPLSIYEAARRLRVWKDAPLFVERPSTSAEGIALLTVHAAKGLEFDVVYLVDLLRQSPSESPWVLFKAGLPPGIRYNSNGERQVSSSYDALLEERKFNSEMESRRILYVAATRAMKELVVSLPVCREGLPKASWAALFAAYRDGGF